MIVLTNDPNFVNNDINNHLYLLLGRIKNYESNNSPVIKLLNSDIEQLDTVLEKKKEDLKKEIEIIINILKGQK